MLLAAGADTHQDPPAVTALNAAHAEVHLHGCVLRVECIRALRPSRAAELVIAKGYEQPHPKPRISAAGVCGARTPYTPTVPGIDPLAPFRLDGKVAIVTGASSGLGARFARVLDAAGARVVLAARRKDRLDALAGELTDALAVESDLASPEAPGALVDTTVDHCGRLDVLVNNAGTNHIEPATETPLDAFRAEVEINLVAPFALAAAAARAMQGSGGGSIVNVASIWGMVGVGQIPDAGYAATKGGLVNMTRELAAQWARTGVRVNTLAPGWFRSEMTEGTMFGDEGAERWMRQRTPMGRGGEEHELDGALLFLASGASSFVTGAVLPVDGGWTAI